MAGRKVRGLGRRRPGYLLHKPSGQARVVLSGRNHYLGPHGSPESHEKYAELLKAWEALGRRPTERVPTADEVLLTVEQLCDAYLEHCRVYYRHPDGSPTGEADNVEAVLERLKESFRTLPARRLGLVQLKQLREAMIEDGLARTTINAHVGRLIRMIGWGVEEQLLPAHLYGEVRALRPLPRGRSRARETEPRRPVEWKTVKKTLPRLSPQLRALVLVMWHSGMRCGEAVQLRTRDVDMTGKVWVFRPRRHKTAHRGRTREIDLGPQVQAVLRPFVRLDPNRYWFRPVDAVAARRKKAREERETPLWPSHVAVQERKRKENPKRTPGDVYDTRAVAHAIRRACKRAKVEPWSPHQLRHAALTRIRKRFGIQAAIAVGGHASAQMTEHYTTEATRKLAADVMRKIG